VEEEVDMEQADTFYENGCIHIHSSRRSGFPLLLIAGGGLNSTISYFTRTAPFNPIEELKGEYRCISVDLRNANGGQSSGPLEIDRPWDSHTDDQLGVMDHLGINQFLVVGFCIGGPFIWNLLKRAPDRIVASVLVQPVGFRPEMPTLIYDLSMSGWGEVSMFPWKEPKETIPLAVRQIRSFPWWRRLAGWSWPERRFPPPWSVAA
jgi:pimeloyl-ACP methyl ester carboxylesterase